MITAGELSGGQVSCRSKPIMYRPAERTSSTHFLGSYLERRRPKAGYKNKSFAKRSTNFDKI